MNFVAPCSVVLFALFIRLSLLLSHETNPRCIYSHTNLTSSIGTTSHWVKLAVLWQKRLTKQSAILKSSCRPDAVFLNFLLLLCGDVSLNPGPGVKHPCGVCVKPVKSNQKAIQCDYCNRWYHARCCNINNPIYDALANSSCMWICCDCGLPSFSSSFFDSSSEASTSNYFSPLNDITSITRSSSFNATINDDQPFASSTPCRQPPTSRRDGKGSIPTQSQKNRKASQCTSTVRVMSLNCCSLRSHSKRLDFQLMVATYKPDIINANETHIDNSIFSSEILGGNYTIFRKDRNLNGGGVLTAISNKLIATHESNLDSNCEAVWTKVHVIGNKPLYIGSIYRAPNCAVEPLECLDQTLNRLAAKSLPNIVLTGDFNLPDLVWDEEDGYSLKPSPAYGTEVNTKLLDIINDHSMFQHVKHPTRKGNILDLVLTTNPNLVKNVQVIDGMSDHDAVLMDITLKPSINRKQPRKVFLFKKGDIESARNDLKIRLDSYLTNNPQDKSVDENYNFLTETVLEVMKEHFPQKKLGSRWNVPWMNNSIKRMIRKKQKLYNRARKSNGQTDWKKFKDLRKATKKRLTLAHDKYLLDLLKTDEMDFETRKPTMTKRFWTYIRSKRQDNVGVAPLEISDDIVCDSREKANLLSNYFKSVFTKEDLQNMPPEAPSPYADISPIHFSTAGIMKLLQKVDCKKANGPDGIPCFILKEAAAEIAPFLQFLFTQSLHTGSVPQAWLKATVVPVYKKGNRNQVDNYRPISLTSVPCKIMEHIIFHEMMSHLDSNQVLVNYQHGFRKKLSCETQLICTVEEIARSLDKGEETDLIIMDFSKAFDSVPHQRLLMKLRYYGIRGILNTWLTQWLTCRSQSVVVDGYNSPDAPVLSGVPQGTVLGPLLFLLYINDLGENCTSRMRLFADDTLIYSTIESYDDAAKLQLDLTALQEWAQKWQMKFNPSKCHVLRISRKQNPVESNYVLMGKVLDSVTHHPYLGVELSSNLDWGQHVNNKVMKANRSLGFLRRNLSSCPEGVKEAAYKAIVRPHVEYASSVWDPHLKKHVKQIEGVQRRAARFVKNCYTREPGTVTNLLNELNWIPLKERRTISRLTLFHKAIHGDGGLAFPDYVTKRSRHLRNSNQNKFIELLPNTETYKNGYFCRTVKDWNALPNEIVNIKSADSFKKVLLEYFSQ